MPAAEVDGVGAIDEDTPPVGLSYQLKLAPLDPVADNWTAVAPKQ